MPRPNLNRQCKIEATTSVDRKSSDESTSFSESEAEIDEEVCLVCGLTRNAQIKKRNTAYHVDFLF